MTNQNETQDGQELLWICHQVVHQSLPLVIAILELYLFQSSACQCSAILLMSYICLRPNVQGASQQQDPGSIQSFCSSTVQRWIQRKLPKHKERFASKKDNFFASFCCKSQFFTLFPLNQATECCTNQVRITFLNYPIKGMNFFKASRDSEVYHEGNSLTGLFKFIPTTKIEEFFEKNLSKSITKLTHFILNESPQDVTRDQLFQLFLVQRELENWKEVISLCEKMLNVDANDVLFLIHKEEALYKSDKSSQSTIEDIFNLIKDYEIKSAEDYYIKGKCFTLMNRRPEAFPFYLDSAENGFPRGMYATGLYYDHGVGVEKNPHKAFEWYNKAANHGDLSSWSSLGFCYLHGIGIEKDEEKAYQSFKKGSEFGHPRSKYNLALCYEKGMGTFIISDKAMMLYHDSAMQGDVLSMYTLGYKYKHGNIVEKDLKEAANYFYQAGKKGHAPSQYEMGLAYTEGSGVKQNDKIAFQWIKAAATNGNLPAMKVLGFMYSNGTGCDADLGLSCEAFSQGAQRGDETCMVEVARCFKRGFGVDKDPQEAEKWLKKARSLGLNVEYKSL